MKLITVDPATKQPSMDYAQWINIIHGHQGEAAAKDRKSFQVTDQDFQGEEPIDTSPDGTIKVYAANSPQQCIILGKGHSFCISQPGNTMWQSYRDSKHSTFYFVKDSSRNDRLSTVVVDMTRNGPELTDVVNTTGTTLDPYTGKTTTETDPYFKYLKEKGINVSEIEHVGQTPEEQKENQKLGSQKQNLNWFVNLSHTEKSKYIGRGHLLTDEQFDYLWENGFKSLLEQYAKTGLKLSDYQIDKIATNSDTKSNYVHNRILANDHTEDMNGREFELLNQKQKENVLNKTKNIERIIFTSKNPDETAEFIIQNKKDLNDNNVFDLLHYVKNKDEIAQLLGSENINKLNNNYVYSLLKYAKNPDEIAKLIIQYKDLTNDNIYMLLKFATDKNEVAKLLGSENINKLDDDYVPSLVKYAENPDGTENRDEMAKLIIQYKDLTDDNVHDLIYYTNDKDGIANLIIQSKKDLNDYNVFLLLRNAKNKEEIAQLLGTENINKLTDDYVPSLLKYAENPDEMRSVLQKYGRIQ